MAELFLNLAWLLLLLPAVLLWRRRHYSVSGTTALLTLACLLLILFPVISASDDLSLMRAEMEDASGAERTAVSSSSKQDTARFVMDAVFLATAVYQPSESQVLDRIEVVVTAPQAVTAATAIRPRSPPPSV